ncbi:MAG TPA: 2'-5' RNA ligase family protein [Candidatus Nanopelagicales bacterium]|jgi:2'-5' RNA ligase|nr:2'-5' RNA ligase family protein [Candidatus Nanopelagicales bacterium]
MADPARHVRRYGVAVEVPEPAAAALAAARRGSGDPAADHMPPHVTLVPPVSVTAPVGEVEQVLRAGAAQVQPFTVHLRGTGTFRPVSEVVFVAVAAGIADLERLAAAVRRSPLDPPRRFPYHPHVTVAQDVAGEELDAVFDKLADFDTDFVVTSVRLYEHADPAAPTGQRWFPVLDLPLG